MRHGWWFETKRGLQQKHTTTKKGIVYDKTFALTVIVKVVRMSIYFHLSEA